MPKRRRSRDEWSVLIAELDRSGEDVRSFADRHDLNVNTLRWWRCRLRHALTLVQTPLVEAEHVDEVVIELGDAIRVRLQARSATPSVGGFVATLAKELRP